MILELLFLLNLAYRYGTDNLYNPEQLRLSWAEEEDAMVITWAAQLPNEAAIVEFTPISSPEETTEMYLYRVHPTWKSFNNDPNNPSSRSLHVCSGKMTNLSQGSYYQYRVGSESLGWSKPYTFQAKPTFKDSPTRFLVLADLGIGNDVVDTVERLTKEVDSHQYDAILHAGDLAYDLNTDEGRVGDTYFRNIEPIVARIPYMVAQGNHESWSTNSDEHFRYRLNMPGGNENYYYSFNAGLAHVVVWTAEFLMQGYPELHKMQMEFLRNDLAELDRKKHPWVISLSHRPLYCSPDFITNGRSLDCIKNSLNMRAEFEDVFYENGVDLHLFGHVHAYERLAPAYRNSTVLSEYDDQHTHINPKVASSIIIGNAGQQEEYTPISRTPLPFSMYQTAELGYGRVVVFNRTHLLFEEVKAHDQEILDYLWIIKN
jgi:predicted phosphohydrolase